MSNPSFIHLDWIEEAQRKPYFRGMNHVYELHKLEYSRQI